MLHKRKKNKMKKRVLITGGNKGIGLGLTKPEYINGTTVDINNGSFPR
jgi:NAD(P)-dependent dehydrogenase (short-subunit alcohol dehydrogenase family)